MGCCSGDDDYKPGPDQAVKRFEERRCTDIFWLLLFIGFWVGMFVVCGIAFDRGGTDRLFYGTDSYGFLCGSDNSDSDLAKPVLETEATLTKAEYPDFSDRKKLYTIDQLQFFSTTTAISGRKVCVSSCPAADDELCMWSEGGGYTCSETVTSKQMTCAYARYADYNYGDFQYLPASTDDWKVDYYEDITRTDMKNYSKVYGVGPCYPNWIKQDDVINRCVPALDSDVVTLAEETFKTVNTDFANAIEGSVGSEFLENAVGDLMKGMLIIFVAGVIVAVALSALWLIILRYMAGVFVWLTVLLLNILTIVVTIYCAMKAGLVGEDSEAVEPAQDQEELDRWKAYTYTSIVITCLLFLFTLIMIPRIKIAVATLKVACQAVGAVPTVMLWPIIPVLFEVLFIVYWLFVMVFLYSSGDVAEVGSKSSVFEPLVQPSDIVEKLGLPADYNSGIPDTKFFSQYAPEAQQYETACADSPDCAYEVSWDRDLQYAALYHIFGLFWTNEFILGMGYMVLAMVFAQFYFYRGERERLPKSPVWESFKTVGRKHLGSVALGSFIVAVIKMIRFLVEQTEKQLKQKMGMDPNGAMKIIFAIMKYCLWLIEKIMKFINKNAYIMVAITGKGYCWSAIHAISLILKNILRFATVNIIGSALLWLGKLTITAGAAVVAFAMTDAPMYSDAEEHPDTALSSPILVIILSAVVAYFVAEVFLQVFDMGVDTILLCFCEDCEQHGGTPAYAPPLLMEAIGKGEEYEKERAARKGGAGATHGEV